MDLLPATELKEQGSYWIFGEKKDGKFAPRRLGTQEIKTGADLHLFQTQPHTEACYLILPEKDLPIDRIKDDELRRMVPDRKLLYDYFADWMHEGHHDRCRVVDVSTDTAKRLLPEAANDDDILAKFSNIFPKVPHGYGRSAKMVPVADFVAFCLRKSSDETPGRLSAVVIIADVVETEHDTVLLRLIDEQPDVEAIEKLLQRLAVDTRLEQLTEYSAGSARREFTGGA